MHAKHNIYRSNVPDMVSNPATVVSVDKHDSTKPQELVFKSKIRLKSPKSQKSRCSKTSNLDFSGFLAVFLT